MKYLVASLVCCAFLLSLGQAAQASEEVRVFQPRMVQDEGGKSSELSPSEMRSRALQLGFGQGVMQSALKLLPQTPTEERKAALESFVKNKAGDWVLGYKEMAVKETRQGLNMVLEVDVNRRALRDVLEQLGLDRPFAQQRTASIQRGTALLEADKAALVSVMQLANVVEQPGADPRISLDRMESGILRGVLESQRGSWTAMEPDVETLWFTLWKKYNSMTVTRATGGVELIVSGWFTPDGVNDFDRALQGWDDLVRSARMTEMDLNTAGVAARWTIQPMDMNRLQARLKEYLPARGLEYTLRTSR